MNKVVNVAAAAVVAVIGSSVMLAMSSPSNAGQMMPKRANFCPAGSYDAGGGYCQSHNNNSRYLPKNGTFCPGGTYDAGGGYCKSN